MAFILSQKNTDIKIHTSLGPDTLIVDEFYGEEVLNAPYEFTSLVHAKDANIDFDTLLGKTVSIEMKGEKKPRFFSGIVGKIEHIKTLQIEKTKVLAFYSLKIYPKFWLLKFSKDHRIFQKKSALDIIKEILGEKKVTEFKDETQKSGKTVRDFCVQYGESYFDFVCRLMEEEGIFYYFSHENGKHTLILVDGNGAAKPITPEKIPYKTSATHINHFNMIHELRAHQQITPIGARVVDFNYEKPSTPLKNLKEDKGDGDTIYDYPGLFDAVGDGDKIAQRRQESHLWGKSGVTGQSTVLDFAPFKVFTITDSPRKKANEKFIIYSVKHKIFNQRVSRNDDEDGDELVYENTFSGFSNTTPFQPQMIHEKQRIHCSQTAIVTGPPGEEIFTDKYGRVKIKFHWDVKGKKDDKSSCWVRVAQNWAGSGWGGLVTPRVGMEVVVSFLDGDPDRPLIIGCVYNADKMPPYVGSKPTQSTFKTESSKGGGGFNELRFEDKKGSEEIYFHAEKDFNTDIINSRTETIEKKDDTLTLEKGSKYVNIDGMGTKYKDTIKQGDRILEIKQGNRKIDIAQGNHDINIATGMQKLTITKGDSMTTITSGNAMVTLGQGNMIINVSGNTMIKSTGMMNFESAGPMMFKSAAAIAIQSGAATSVSAGAAVSVSAAAAVSVVSNAAIALTANGAFNVKANAAVNIESMAMARFASQGMTMVEGAMTTVQGKAMATLQGTGMANVMGALVKIN